MNSLRSPGSGRKIPRTIVIIPAHNEASDIGRVIAEVREVTAFPVVVVDDASSDDTRELARSAGAIVIPLSVQLGAWAQSRQACATPFQGILNTLSPWTRTASMRQVPCLP